MQEVERNKKRINQNYHASVSKYVQAIEEVYQVFIQASDVCRVT